MHIRSWLLKQQFILYLHEELIVVISIYKIYHITNEWEGKLNSEYVHETFYPIHHQSLIFIEPVCYMDSLVIITVLNLHVSIHVKLSHCSCFQVQALKLEPYGYL